VATTCVFPRLFPFFSFLFFPSSLSQAATCRCEIECKNMRADGQRHGRPLPSKGRTASDYERTVSNSSTRVTTLSFCYLALRTSKCGHTTHPGYLVYVHQLHNGMQNRGELLARSVCQQLPNMVPRQGGLTVLIPRQEGVRRLQWEICSCA